MSDLVRVSTTPERLREAMTSAGKRQADLVRETGLNKSTISRYLKGEMEPKSDAIYKLAVSLNVGEMWLWGFDVPKERTPTQKKNDKLAKLVVRLRRDDKLFSILDALSELPDDQLASFGTIIAGLKQNKIDQVE